MEQPIATRQRGGGRAFGMLGVLALLLTLAFPLVTVQAQDDEEAPQASSEVPSFGAARPGPIRLAQAAVAGDAVAVNEEEAVPEGVTPVSILIESAGIDAPIERVDIVDGVMQNPSGPWVVSWYDDLPALGEGGNVVMAGHVDYWDTGPAVFWELPNLAEGDVIQVVGENGDVYEYSVQWSRLYDVATELTPEVIQADVVGETDEESLTLITCGGDFNVDTQEYVSRRVLRAVRI